MKVTYDDKNRPVFHIEDKIDQLIYDLMYLTRIDIAMTLTPCDSYNQMEERRATAEKYSESVKKQLIALTTPK